MTKTVIVKAVIASVLIGQNIRVNWQVRIGGQKTCLQKIPATPSPCIFLPVLSTSTSVTTAASTPSVSSLLGFKKNSPLNPKGLFAIPFFFINFCGISGPFAKYRHPNNPARPQRERHGPKWSAERDTCSIGRQYNGLLFVHLLWRAGLK